MSVRVGPIHHWLYRKINIQKQLVNSIIQKAKEFPELQNNLAQPLPSINQPLEDVIDATNIHGWLQERIHEVELALATTLQAVLSSHPERMNDVKALFESSGSEATTIENTSSVHDVYKELQDTLLDGMPCDRVNVVVEQNDHEILWQRTSCVHSQYYDSLAIGVSTYYELRDSFIKGLLVNSNITYELIDEQTYRLYEASL